MSNASRWPTGRLGERIAARVVCEQLLARFHANVDAGRATDGVELFAPGALIDLPAGRAQGYEEIGRLLSARQAASGRITLHAVGSFDFQMASGHEASASGALVVYAGELDNVGRVPEAVARYAAGFRRDDRGWSISGLEVELVGGGVATRR
jgi:hypothetical protein